MVMMIELAANLPSHMSYIVHGEHVTQKKKGTRGGADSIHVHQIEAMENEVRFTKEYSTPTCIRCLHTWNV